MNDLLGPGWDVYYEVCIQILNGTLNFFDGIGFRAPGDMLEMAGNAGDPSVVGRRFIPEDTVSSL